MTSVSRELCKLAGGTVVIDPYVLRADSFEKLLIQTRNAGARLMLYGELNTVFRTRLLAASRELCVELFLTDVSAPESTFREVLALDEESVCARVLHGLIRNIVSVPRPFGNEVLRIFGWAPLPASATDLSRRLGASSRTVYWCAHTRVCAVRSRC